MGFNLFVCIGIVLCLNSPACLQDKFNIAESINKFSVDLLAKANLEGGEDINIALSPLTIWAMLSVLSEGANGTTADQLNRALGQPQNKNNVRDSYQNLTQLISQEMEMETSIGIFLRSDFSVKGKFETITKQYYDASITSVDFSGDKKEAANVINKYVAKGTRNRFPEIVNSDDVTNAYLFLTTTLYFKGQWTNPFNRSATYISAFFDDKRNRIGVVPMMYQAYPFPYAIIDKILADALELPYGIDDEFSMLVLVPRGAQTLTFMLNAFAKKKSITEILARLKNNHQKFHDIHVYLPKFKMSSDLNLNSVLNRMGIRDIFDPDKVDLPGMSPDTPYLYLSRIIQRAEVEVNEEGIVTSATAGSIFLNGPPPSTVRADRPFAFFILHKKSASVVFAGKISNLSTLRK